nr:hypothetical protein [Bovine gammaherpesvirus 4]
MASGTRKTPKAQPTMEDLEAKIAQLQLENKQLKKRIKHGTDPQPLPGDPIVTPAQREAMIGAATAALTSQAAKKIEAKVRHHTSRAVTKEEVEAAIANIRIRVDLSMEDVTLQTQKPKVRGRSASKPR